MNGHPQRLPFTIVCRAMSLDTAAPCLTKLLAAAPAWELGSGQAVESARASIAGWSESDDWRDCTVVNESLREACQAGLWLRFNFLDESHRLSQEIATPTGSYWHAIMHRREGDFSNSKYWLRQVGHHEIDDSLASAARQVADKYQQQGRELPPAASFLTAPGWDPYRFVDLCQAAVTGRVDAAELCRYVQQHEWALLFDFCWRHARKEAR